MIYKTYLNKVSTIIEDSKVNVGVSPISTMVYGTKVSRMLINFDESKLLKLCQDKHIVDLNKCKHILNITNCGSVENDGYLDVRKINNVTNAEYMMRASSFDLIFFRIPHSWDAGNGYDFKENLEKNNLISYNGVNWFKPVNGGFWDEPGIYSTDTLSREYDKFSCIDEQSSVIISRQHFDTGNENIKVDITPYVNAVLRGDVDNYGIGVAFTPLLESTLLEESRFISFFTNKTNTFFEPYIETIYEDTIVDDRNKFYLDKNNKLYLYCNAGESLVNLDELPTCTVDGVKYDVKQATKGVYYIDINLSSKKYNPRKMLYDVWGNIKYNGVEMDDIEMDFVLLSPKLYFNFSNKINNKTKYIPEIYGFKDSEIIQRGDIRKVVFLARKPYTREEFALLDNMELRLYVKDGNDEIDVISYDKINQTFNENYYLIDTSTLIPNHYFIDVKVKVDQEEIIHHNIVNFKIVNNLTEKYK